MKTLSQAKAYRTYLDASGRSGKFELCKFTKMSPLRRLGAWRIAEGMM